MSHPRTIVEIKHTLDGREQRFTCRALLVTRYRAVVRFDHLAERVAGGFVIPVGSHTLGFFWLRRPYNCYRFAGPDDSVIAYRFDVVEAVAISATAISYRDLLLDLWFSAGGTVTVEDEDEVAAARADGLLSVGQLDRIGTTRARLERNHRRIAAEVEGIAANL